MTEPVLMTVKQVMAITGLCRTTIHIQSKNGNFPKPVKVTRHAIRWRRVEVMAWLENLEQFSGKQGRMNIKKTPGGGGCRAFRVQTFNYGLARYLQCQILHP